MTAALLVLILISVSLTAIAQVILRKAMLAAAPLPPLEAPVKLALHLAANVYLWAGLLCFAISVALWLGVLSRIPVSVAYPMASIGYIIAAAGGALLLGEAITPARALGLLLICGGVWLVAGSA